MPFENMFSLVIAQYGRGALLPPAAGLHQYQDGRWIQVMNGDAMITVPAHLTPRDQG